jgi:Transketolase, thiamine diphosphate binding domain
MAAGMSSWRRQRPVEVSQGVLAAVPALRPDRPVWPNRDRFVLSPAHASALLWSMLHLMRVQPLDPDYEVLGTPAVSLDDLRRFRQLDSKAPGHPEHRWTSGKGNADIDAKELTMATNTHATRNGRPRPEGAGLVRRLRLGFRGSGSPDRVAPAGSRLARDCVGVKLSFERRVLTGRDRIVQTIRARNCVIVNTRIVRRSSARY